MSKLIWFALIMEFGLSVHASPPCLSELGHAEIEEVLSRVQFTRSDKFTVNPKGNYLAYTSQPRAKEPTCDNYLDNGVPGRTQGARIFLSTIPPGRLTELCPRGSTCFHPSWSPDGKLLAFYSDQGGKLGLWLYDVSDGKSHEAKSLAVDNIKASFWPGDEPRWSPDSKTVFVSRRTKRNLEKIKDCEKALLSDPGINGETRFKEENIGEILSINVANGSVHTLVPESSDPAPNVFRLSPTGTWLAYLSVPRPKGSDAVVVHDLVLKRTSGKGDPIVVASELPAPDGEYNSRNFRWHPKNDQLIFVKAGRLQQANFNEPSVHSKPLRSELSDVTDQLMLYNQSGDTLLVGLKPKKAADSYQTYPTELALVPLDSKKAIERFPLPPHLALKSIVPTSENTFWENDTYLFAAEVEHEGKTERLGLRKKNRVWDVLSEGGKYRYSPSGTTPDGLIANVERESHPSELYALDSFFQPTRPLTHLQTRPAISAPLEIKTFVTHSIVGDENQRLRTTLILPPNLEPGTKPPTVIIGYGGEDLSKLPGGYFTGDPSVAIPNELLLRAGYAVALVSLPMGPMEINPSTVKHEPMKEILEGLLPQVETLSKSGLVDSERFALLGHSYGGYTVAAVGAQTDRFKALIASGGIYDLEQTKWRDWASAGQGRMGEIPSNPAAIARYHRNSPLQSANRIKSPLLIVHGKADDNYFLAEKLYNAVKINNPNVELASFDGEGHAPPGWTLEHHTEAASRILNFLKRNLGPGACLVRRAKASDAEVEEIVPHQ